MNAGLIIAAGLVNWLSTTIIVESELVRPVRDYVANRRAAMVDESLWTQGDDDRSVWRWLDYLLRCHLCVGVWVGLAEAIYLGPLVGRGILGIVFTGLLVKAVGHLVLELRPQAWPR